MKWEDNHEWFYPDIRVQKLKKNTLRMILTVTLSIHTDTMKIVKSNLL